ncbi:hypothetical protein QLQ12_27665 [Actinoplanes sp. NEAU-A12]|uniref:Uncharacterized protein n=1 Tax=Actinoplanes sandaracinus TaxID=3045177 RepID=A0ABT6WRN7_9ACTN|nr:hypothetical protein [Actinoplanes sandaracinus]MDI6102402.1 hypothetical protein [Actinoplanes sandaracinus]
MATSTGVDWRIAAGALAAAVPDGLVAVVTVGPGDPPAGRPAGTLHLADAGQIGLERARSLIGAMVRAYDLVLISTDAGLLVPVGRDGWTLVDLAVALAAPAVVVTGSSPDAENHTTLALDALTGRGIAAHVVTVGEVELSMKPAGRIPADPPADFAGAAEWFDPDLELPTAPPEPPERPAMDGRRFVLRLLGVFVVMVLLACGMGWCSTGYP